MTAPCVRAAVALAILLSAAWSAACAFPSGPRSPSRAGAPSAPAAEVSRPTAPAAEAHPPARAQAPSTAWPSLPAREYLEGRFWRRFFHRARLRRYGAARATSHGSVLADPQRDAWPWEQLFTVVFVRGDRVRIVADVGDARLLLWLERGDLAEVVTAETTLVRRPGAAVQRAPGITLHQGYPVAVQARADGHARIVHRDDWVEFEGWLPAERLGYVFEVERGAEDGGDAGDADGDAYWGDGFEAAVARGALIYDAPGGAALARFAAPHQPSQRGVACDLMETGVEGWYAVRYRDDSITIYGFVRVEDVAEAPSYGSIGGILGSSKDPRLRVLPPGTCLFDPETGEEIGVIHEERPVPTWRAEDGAGYLVEIGTRWGTIEVNVEPGDGAVGPEWPARWRQCQGSP